MKFLDLAFMETNRLGLSTKIYKSSVLEVKKVALWNNFIPKSVLEDKYFSYMAEKDHGTERTFYTHKGLVEYLKDYFYPLIKMNKDRNIFIWLDTRKESYSMPIIRITNRDNEIFPFEVKYIIYSDGIINKEVAFSFENENTIIDKFLLYPAEKKYIDILINKITRNVKCELIDDVEFDKSFYEGSKTVSELLIVIKSEILNVSL